MAPELTIEDAVARARQAEERRIDAVRRLAEAQQDVTAQQQASTEKVAQAKREGDELVAAAQKENARRYSEALSAGWTAAELRKIGFRDPKRGQRTKRRRSAPDTPTESDTAAD
ncbi:hypothetical protein GCM10011575_47190 [Microlunatus endophyticus]|uniref:Uncharacterized protein n=1 Tax=Microlunatus endophyticus TaxID=1716077 RepID=A0A917SKM4_9ACTN|nr:hypothetical protein [Microlunatus endophyticus]GGL83415.1 hypothetical protein GCM10011575_47190 [Microlunatus endophyticus]